MMTRTPPASLRLESARSHRLRVVTVGQFARPAGGAGRRSRGAGQGEDNDNASATRAAWRPARPGPLTAAAEPPRLETSGSDSRLEFESVSESEAQAGPGPSRSGSAPAAQCPRFQHGFLKAYAVESIEGIGHRFCAWGVAPGPPRTGRWLSETLRRSSEVWRHASDSDASHGAADCRNGTSGPLPGPVRVAIIRRCGGGPAVRRPGRPGLDSRQRASIVDSGSTRPAGTASCPAGRLSGRPNTEPADRPDGQPGASLSLRRCSGFRRGKCGSFRRRGGPPADSNRTPTRRQPVLASFGQF